MVEVVISEEFWYVAKHKLICLRNAASVQILMLVLLFYRQKAAGQHSWLDDSESHREVDYGEEEDADIDLDIGEASDSSDEDTEPQVQHPCGHKLAQDLLYQHSLIYDWLMNWRVYFISLSWKLANVSTAVDLLRVVFWLSGLADTLNEFKAPCMADGSKLDELAHLNAQGTGLSNHIIICGASESFVSFAQQVRKCDPISTPLVILHPEIPKGIWPELKALGPLHFVKASPSSVLLFVLSFGCLHLMWHNPDRKFTSVSAGALLFCLSSGVKSFLLKEDTKGSDLSFWIRGSNPVCNKAFQLLPSGSILNASSNSPGLPAPMKGRCLSSKLCPHIVGKSIRCPEPEGSQCFTSESPGVSGQASQAL